MIKIPCLYGVILFCLALPATGQRIDKPLAVIPFRYDGTRILFPVTVNGSSDTLHFLFDSGCEVNLLSLDKAHRLGLQIEDDAGLSGWRKEMTMMPKAQARSINMAALTIPYPEFYLQDLAGSAMEGIPVDGVMGYDLLKRYIVKIDFHRREMSIYQSGSFRYPAGSELLKLAMNYKTPVVEASLTDDAGQVFHSTYHVITGGDFGLLLNGAYVKKYGLDTRLQKKGTVIRQDLLQPVTYMQCVVPRFTIGQNNFDNVPAMYSAEVNDASPDKEIAGAIGAWVWKYFTLIINLPGKELCLSNISGKKE